MSPPEDNEHGSPGSPDQREREIMDDGLSASEGAARTTRAVPIDASSHSLPPLSALSQVGCDVVQDPPLDEPAKSAPGVRSQPVAAKPSSSVHALVVFGSIFVAIVLVLSALTWLTVDRQVVQRIFDDILDSKSSASIEKDPSEAMAWVGVSAPKFREHSVASQVPVVAEEVLSDAEILRGELFGRGTLSVGSATTSLADSLTLLDKNRTVLVVALFAQQLTSTERERIASLASLSALSEEDSPLRPALMLIAELSPFGTDCSPISIRQYRWHATHPTTGTAIEISRNPHTADLSEFKKLDCYRRNGEIFFLHAEGTARASVPQAASQSAQKKASHEIAEVSWSVTARNQLVFSEASR